MVKESSQAPPPPDDNPQGNGDAAEQITPVKLSLDERFTAWQMQHLEENKEKYRYSSRAARKELVQATLQHFVDKLVELGETVDRPKRVAIKEVRPLCEFDQG